MSFSGVSFSIASYAAWAPGMETKDAWIAWAKANHFIAGDIAAPVQAMPPMLRRRAGFLDKMALEVAYECLGQRVDVPIVFSSRHGEAARSVDLLLDLAKGVPLSPTSFNVWASASMFLQSSAPDMERLRDLSICCWISRRACRFLRRHLACRSITRLAACSRLRAATMPVISRYRLVKAVLNMLLLRPADCLRRVSLQCCS